ncbi:MAG: MBL fold metallo-hydrolase [Coriobacteriales bacterium]|nr:MBL fold metallo-hydrolase [Coriobacteriales bacterium]MBQ6586627.1 MBL fold metallo-hydrolase [Coriobacteriales bacterium]
MTTMLYQGHGSYRFTLDDGTVIYVDPFAGDGYDLPADLILVTHEHFDHTQVRKMPHAAGCEIIRAADLHPTPYVYHTLLSHGVQVTGVQACNRNHPIDECVGMIIEMDGFVFYASGDTSMTEDMRSGRLALLPIDYAAFCGDGVYNMDIDEASECARMVGARHNIPVHLVPVSNPFSKKVFSREIAERFQAPGRIILEPGQTLELEHA